VKLQLEVGTCLRYCERGVGSVGWWRVLELTEGTVTMEAGGEATPAPGAAGARRQKTLKRASVRGPNWQVVP
jgi:hypothetical protein